MRRRSVVLATALGAIALVVGPAVSPAGAGDRSGHQSFRLTIYEVNPNGVTTGVGPIYGDGVIDAKGMDHEVDSAPTDPPNSNRDIITFRNGTVTVVSLGGNGGAPKVDDACNFSLRIDGQQTNVVSGTGAYANASGHFTSEIRVNGVLPRNPDGTCNQGTGPLFDTVHVEAEGHLSI